MRATFILSALASLALVSATPLGADVLTKRDPSDKSGNTQIALECTGETLPDPGGDGGAGEGGFGYFTSNMKASIKGGDDIGPTACTDKDGTCSNCLFEDSGLSSSINVTGCWNPPAGTSGCSIEFSYNDYDYNSQNKEPYCGHENSWGPFTDTIVAICYFNA